MNVYVVGTEVITLSKSLTQLGVNVFLALIVGAIFFGVKDDQSGIQNRWENCSQQWAGVT